MSRTTSAGRAEKDDALVTVSYLEVKEPVFSIESPVRKLFAEAQDKVVHKTLASLNVVNIRVDIKDNQALDYVLAARIRAAVDRYRIKDEP